MHIVYSGLKGNIKFIFSFVCFETDLFGDGNGDGNSCIDGSGCGNGEDPSRGDGFINNYGDCFGSGSGGGDEFGGNYIEKKPSLEEK